MQKRNFFFAYSLFFVTNFFLLETFFFKKVGFFSYRIFFHTEFFFHVKSAGVYFSEKSDNVKFIMLSREEWEVEWKRENREWLQMQHDMKNGIRYADYVEDMDKYMDLAYAKYVRMMTLLEKAIKRNQLTAVFLYGYDELNRCGEFIAGCESNPPRVRDRLAPLEDRHKNPEREVGPLDLQYCGGAKPLLSQSLLPAGHRAGALPDSCRLCAAQRMQNVGRGR